MSNPLSIRTLLIKASHRLETLENPYFEAEILLGYLLQKPRAYLIAFSEYILTQEQSEDFLYWIDQRAQGMPTAYITGQKEFWGMTLKVTTDTLIPRPDTECLVETVLQLVHQHYPTSLFSLIDLGTGSGAIALALKKELPSAHVIASDRSAAALGVAQYNAQQLNLSIDWREGDWFEVLTEPVDIICSNPPYIDAEDIALTQNGLPFEPYSALVATQKGYADLLFLITNARQYLKTKGWLVLEHGNTQGATVRQYLQQHHYSHITTQKDYAGHERITYAQIA